VTRSWRPASWSAKAKPTGRTFAADWAMVFGVRDGQITSFRVVEDTAKVAAAFR
jgi:ketosteroid isomerase-like protein